MYGNRGPSNYINYGYPGQIIHDVPMNGSRQQQNAGNHHAPYPAQPQNFDWSQFPFYPQPYNTIGQNYQQGFMQQQPMNYSKKSYPQKDSQFLFHNPLQPQKDMGHASYMPMNGYPVMNPYPKQQSIIPKQAGGMQSFMNSFKSQDGSVDFNKMMNTAGQMMNAVNQVTSLVKGFGGIFKS